MITEMLLESIRITAAGGRNGYMRVLTKVTVAAVIVVVGLLGGYFILKITTPPPLSDEKSWMPVTGGVWEPSTYRVGVPPSYAKWENGVFTATARQSSTGFYGASLIQQGDNPHGWWNLTQESEAKLNMSLTIYKDQECPLLLEFAGRRTSQIEWFSEGERGNNIGVLLVGDVGLGYYNSDTSKPHALFIDIWPDTNPQLEQRHWGGSSPENDYHSGFPVESMPEIDKEYNFSFQIDSYIKDALTHWNLSQFTLMMVQVYVEAEASEASIEVSRIALRTQDLAATMSPRMVDAVVSSTNLSSSLRSRELTSIAKYPLASSS